MIESTSPASLIVRWAFPIALLAFVLATFVAPAQWTPWLAGLTLAVVGIAMTLRPKIFAFAHPFGVRLAGIFILGISAFVGVSRLIELY